VPYRIIRTVKKSPLHTSLQSFIGLDLTFVYTVLVYSVASNLVAVDLSK
jgi:hypothetical protein